MQYLYIIKCNQFYKIGITNNVKKRLKDLQSGNPYILELIGSFEVKNPRLAESVFHNLLSRKNVVNEWFELNTEELSLLIETCDLFRNSNLDYFFKVLLPKWDLYKAEQTPDGLDFNVVAAIHHITE